jgi:CRP-like cAMP-binding protein
MKENKGIRRSPLFDGLKEEEFKRLLKLFERRKYPPLSSIFLENIPGSELFLLERGLVKITKIRGEFDSGGEGDPDVDVPPGALEQGVGRVLVHIRPGEFFGEMSFLDGLPRSASAFAVEECELLVIERGAFDTLMDRDAELALKLSMNMSRILSKRLRQTDQLLVGLADVLYRL